MTGGKLVGTVALVVALALVVTVCATPPDQRQGKALAVDTLMGGMLVNPVRALGAPRVYRMQDAETGAVCYMTEAGGLDCFMPLSVMQQTLPRRMARP